MCFDSGWTSWCWRCGPNPEIAFAPSHTSPPFLNPSDISVCHDAVPHKPSVFSPSCIFSASMWQGSISFLHTCVCACLRACACAANAMLYIKISFQVAFMTPPQPSTPQFALIADRRACALEADTSHGCLKAAKQQPYAVCQRHQS